ncbi:MAG: 50S ribosomal protein L10 [Planctomycetota bacterium]|jgi:large subunit ribosomal protein L10
MPSELKELLAAEIARELKGVEDLLLVDASKLSAQKAGELRGRFEEAGIRFRVVKNRLAFRAFHAIGIESLDPVLQGPTAVIWGEEGSAAISKIVSAWNKKEPPIQIKGGLLEGKAGSAEEVKAWAGLPSRPEMLSALLASILSPASGVAGAFEASLGQFARLVAAHIEKLEAKP